MGVKASGTSHLPLTESILQISRRSWWIFPVQSAKDEETQCLPLSGGVNPPVADIAKPEWHGDIKVHCLNGKDKIWPLRAIPRRSDALPSGSVLPSSTDSIWMRRHALHSGKVRGLICWCGSSEGAAGVYFCAEKRLVRRARTPWCVPPAFFIACAFWSDGEPPSAPLVFALDVQPSAFLLICPHCHERVSLKLGGLIFQVQGPCFFRHDLEHSARNYIWLPVLATLSGSWTWLFNTHKSWSLKSRADSCVQCPYVMFHSCAKTDKTDWFNKVKPIWVIKDGGKHKDTSREASKSNRNIAK